jgi:hypothetical protein
MRSLTAKFAQMPEARILVFGPPSLPGYGNASGFTFHLQDRAGGTVQELAAMTQTRFSPRRPNDRNSPASSPASGRPCRR